jgi:glycosyltransferase involved in cell wall biosynthesis
MTSVQFSIVVPLYNAAGYVERCIRALLSQTLPAGSYEILLVDNNSTDRSAEIVRRFDCVRLLNEPEQGSYAARNRGIREAQGEIAAFTDPDCVPREDWLEQIGHAMTDPQTGIVLGDRRFARDSGVLGMLAAYESALGARIFTTQRVNSYYGYTNNMAIGMSIAKALGGFEHRQRGADSLFLRRAVERYGAPVLKYAPEVVVRHLEIAGVRDYLRKKRVYGKVNRDSAVATPQALPLATRWALALQAKRDCSSSLAETIGFLSVLAAGATQFEWERRKIGE